MKQFFIILAIIFMPMAAFGAGIKKGDVAFAPNLGWVDVKNLDTVRGGNSEFIYGDVCGIFDGGTIAVIGIDSERVLARYSIEGAQFGGACPSGIIFFIPKDRFPRMTEKDRAAAIAAKIKAAAEKAKATAEKNLIKRLLRQELQKQGQ